MRNMTDRRSEAAIFSSVGCAASATRHRSLLVHAVGAFFPASTLALVASHLFQIDHSVANIVVIYPVLLLLFPLLLLRHSIPRTRTFYILLVLSLWVVLVFLGVSSVNTASFVRLMSLLLQVVYYWASFLCFYREPKSVVVVWSYATCATIPVLLLANIVNPHIGFSPSYIAFLRYEGLTGPNSHGFIATVSIIALMSLLSIVERPVMRSALLIGVVYALANLWATGSRLSMIAALVFVFVYLPTSKPLQRFLLLLMLLSFGISFLLYLTANEVETIKSLLRLDEYSIRMRLQPIAWGLEKALQNSFWPYGLATLAKEARMQHLDSSYLYLLLELGIPGLALVVGFVALTIKDGLGLISRTVKGSSEQLLSGAALAAFVAMALHGIGETALFVGIQLVSLLFWVTAAFLSASFYRMKRFYPPCAKNQSRVDERSGLMCWESENRDNVKKEGIAWRRSRSFKLREAPVLPTQNMKLGRT